jgi:type II secretory pathway pseudopilin PulG
MKSRLVKILVVLIMVGMALEILFPSITSAINNSTKWAFVRDTKVLLQRIGEKTGSNLSFDPTTINILTIHEILNVNNKNYKSVNVTLIAQKIHITVVGKGKWEGLTTCGTIDGIYITENSSGCI